MATGLSTTTDPYLLAYEPNVHFTSIATAGDVIGTKANGSPFLFVGVPDGLGAYDNGDGTFTTLVNHELQASEGVVRSHGAKGAFITKMVIDKATLAVVSAEDAIQHVNLWDDATQSYSQSSYAISRFCSGDLADPLAYFNAATGLGTNERIYLTGEESGTEGKLFAVVTTGADAGNAYELAYAGLFSWENAVSAPIAQDKTIVLGTDDTGGGQVYVYVGAKQATGSTIDKAGLTGGKLFGIDVGNLLDETDSLIPNGAFNLVDLGDVSAKTGAQLETLSDAAGVTGFLRPEDITWDKYNAGVAYFATTNGLNNPSRLYKLTFTDIANPELGGTIEALLDGTEGQKMFDNITISANGKIILQEDPGNTSYIAKVWEYDIASDKLSQIATHDPAKFTPGVAGFLTQDEESSGVIDVTAMLGDSNTRAFLVADQIHRSLSTEVVQDGQLSVMYIEDVVTQGKAGADELLGSAADETFNGMSGNDTIRAGSGIDVLNGGSGLDTLDGGRGDDRLNGNSGEDQLDGGEGNDTLFGGTEDDVLNGGAGDDTLNGGSESDWLVGGAGADILTGGTEWDVFSYLALSDSTLAAQDIIKDFSHAQGDIIDLAALDADAATAGDQAFTLVNSFSNVAGQLVATKTAFNKYLVQADVDGNGTADFVLTVISKTALISEDFIL